MSLPPPKSRQVKRARPRLTRVDKSGSAQPVRQIGDRIVRIDSPVSSPNAGAVDLDVALAELAEPAVRVESTNQLSTSRPDNLAAAPKASARDWLSYHASDLIDRLTQWSDDLSVREANLNARQAMWDRQARRLRLQFQEAQLEIDEIEVRLNQAQLKVDEREKQLRATARQLAMASL